ncbi:MAG: glycosyltransferase [Liquorilactobacillus nagelii]|nr:glycosyltransferase [Liquorilactobacillus nagelii]MCI1977451.1 glycosyltransferase [Liquorilactobacillus nagelii]
MKEFIGEENIAIVIVTYNPIISILRENVEHYSEKFKVIISDNNSKNVESVLKCFSENKNVILIKHKKNVGIAKAQNDAIKFLFDKYDEVNFFCFFDQDSFLENRNVIKLKEELKDQKKEKVAIIGPNHGSLQKNMGNLIEVNQIISSGSIVEKKVFEDIGFFLEKLFIDFVDYEWCWRAKKKGYKIFMDCSIVLKHQIGLNKKSIKFGKIVVQPRRLYFVFRNCLYLLKSGKIIQSQRKKWYYFLFKQIIFNIIFGDKRLLRFKMIVKGCLESNKV